jgi:DNA-directed RNA polymerase specialized sigma24 family protein
MMKEQFDALLDWLDPDREQAGEKYENVRQGLINVFMWNLFGDAEGMADETINRVARKLTTLRETYKGDPAPYFYGVAKRLMLERGKMMRAEVPLEQAPNIAAPTVPEGDDDERVYECLRHCMERLTPANRQLFVAYYLQEKQGKIDARRELARSMGIELNALRVRVYRIRTALADCIEGCLGKLASGEMD